MVWFDISLEKIGLELNEIIQVYHKEIFLFKNLHIEPFCYAIKSEHKKNLF